MSLLLLIFLGIIKLAMIEIDKFLAAKNLAKDARLLLQVHDELVYEVKEGIVKSIAPEIQKIMENIIPPKKVFGIVCKTNIFAGENWGEMVEIS